MSESVESDIERLHDRRWWTLAVLCLSLLIVFVGNSSLNVAIPTLSRELRRHRVAAPVGRRRRTRSCSPACCSRPARSATASAARARSSSASSLFLVACGARRARRRRCGSSSPAAAVMGAAAAFIMPSTLSILVNVFPPDERTKAIAIWAGIAGAAGAFGPLVERLAARALLVRLGVPRQRPDHRRRARRRVVPRARGRGIPSRRSSIRSAPCCRSSASSPSCTA